MWSKKNIIIFFAGAFAFKTLSHIMLYYANVLPLNFFGFMLTPQLSMFAIALNAAITIALLWWASRINHA